MRLAGLYAGIAGFELGFQSVGAEAVLLADKDESCRLLLAQRFETADVVGDVSEIDDLPSDVDVVTAGFPCQNLSMAGNKAGLDGEKTGDVKQMFDLLRRSRVPLFVLENVYFLLSVDGGQAMTKLVQMIEDLGYSWAYRVVGLQSFGLPHRRRRIVLVASREMDPAIPLFAGDVGFCEQPLPSCEKPLGFYWTEGRSGVGIAVDSIPPLKVGSSIGIPCPPAVLFPDGQVLTPSIEACELLQGFPTGWTDIEFGMRRTPRWRMLGNAMPVPVAEWVAKAITEAADGAKREEFELPNANKWPIAARGSSGRRVGVDVSEFPIRAKPRSISEFRDGNWNGLSARALAGFIKRAKEGRLRFPEGFLDALCAAQERAATKQRV